MEAQYRWLLRNAYMIRIVPAHVPAASAGLVLMEYDKAMPIAYSDTDLAKVFVQDLGAIAKTRLLFNQLEEVALGGEQSRTKLMEYIDSPREDPDASGTELA